jgi:beta-glucosidase
MLLLMVCGLFSCQPEPKEKVAVGYIGAQLGNEQEISDKIDSILSLMTLDEKLGQLSQVNNKGGQHIDSATMEAVRRGEVGSLIVNRTKFYSFEERDMYQQLAVKESRLGIPLIFGHDVIHGFRTIFPTPLAQSCTWSPDLVEKGAAIAAREASAQGVDWAFAPMVDVARDPRWGRIAEGYGEDTYLNAVYGAAVIRGFQGSDVSSPDRIASCMKHYVGYGAGEGGRDKKFTDISNRTLHEVYLPPFKAGLDQGALTVMTAFNDINGVPATANPYTIRKILKQDYKFKGVVLSDWDAVKQLITHGIAKDTLEAAVLALNAGTDMEMKSFLFKKLTNALDQNKISIDYIDDAVRRVLYFKYKLGLFDRPFVEEDRTETVFLTEAHRQAARETARESMVLLKNDNSMLPISSKIKSIAVVGAFARETDVMGWWRSTGEFDDVITALDGIKSNAPEGMVVTETVRPDTEVIVACLGEPSRYFGENHNSSDLRIPEEQVNFLKSMQKYNKPIVLVIFNGRPLDLTEASSIGNSVLVAWHPGTETGNALSDVLFGLYNPSGKLTTSFPNSVGEVPIFYNRRNSGNGPDNSYNHGRVEPLYPFGYGMSYTSFQYDSLQVKEYSIPIDGELEVSATITNTGSKEGQEVVQLYVRDLFGSTTRPIKELKGFQKIKLLPNESKTVSFNLSTKELAVLNEDFVPNIEPGKFQVWIAPNSIGGLLGEFEIIDNP